MLCYRASTSSVAAASCSSSAATSVVSGSVVSTTVSSTASSGAYNMSTVAGRISPSLVDDSSASSACQASTPLGDKPVHHPKKVSCVGWPKYLCLSMSTADFVIEIVGTIISMPPPPFSSNRQQLSYDDCLEVRWEIIRTVLCCIVY